MIVRLLLRVKLCLVYNSKNVTVRIRWFKTRNVYVVVVVVVVVVVAAAAASASASWHV
jgi:hypothetical protein